MKKYVSVLLIVLASLAGLTVVGYLLYFRCSACRPFLFDAACYASGGSSTSSSAMCGTHYVCLSRWQSSKTAGATCEADTQCDGACVNLRETAAQRPEIGGGPDLGLDLIGGGTFYRGVCSDKKKIFSAYDRKPGCGV